MTNAANPFNALPTSHLYNFRAPGPIKRMDLPSLRSFLDGSDEKVLRVKSKQQPESSGQKPVSRSLRHIKLECGTVEHLSPLTREVEKANPLMRKPGEVFMKVWKITNTGKTSWPANLKFRYFPSASKARMECAKDAPLQKTLANPEVKPNESYEIEIELTAPAVAGKYHESWMLVGPGDKPFGKFLRVDVLVVDPYFT